MWRTFVALLAASLFAVPVPQVHATTVFDDGFEPHENLQIASAAFAASAEVGYPYHVYATIRAERVAIGTVVNVLLVPFDPATQRIADIDPLADGFVAETSPVAVVGGYTIPSLAPGETVDIDIMSVLNAEYDDGQPGEILPPGTYVPVVMIDALGETDHASVETLRSDDYRVAGAPIQLLPSRAQAQLDIVEFRPTKPYFYDPDPQPVAGDPWVNGSPDALVTHIAAAFTLQAYGASIKAPVQAYFSVEIPSLTTPGTVERFPVALDNPGLAWPEVAGALEFGVDEVTGDSFGVTEEMTSWPPPENFTPAERAVTVNLQLPDAAKQLLAAHGRDVEVLVRVEVGAPAFATRAFSVVYLQDDPIVVAKAGAGNLVSQRLEQFYGKSNPGGAGFALGFSVDADRPALTSAANGFGEAWVTIFGNKAVLLDGHVDAALDPAAGVTYSSSVTALGRTIASYDFAGGSYSRAVDITYSRKIEYTQRFNIGPVPASITVGANATGGIAGSLTAAPTRLDMAVGPGLEIAGYAKFSAVNLGRFKAGVGADLLFLDLRNPFTAYAQILNPGDPSNTRLQVRYSGPLQLKSLDGKIYAYATLNYVFGKKRWKTDILSWGGIRKTWNWFEPRTITL